IRVQAIDGDGVRFVVSFGYPDAAAAQKTTRDLVAALRGGAQIEVLDPASQPVAPEGPNRAAMVGRGLLAGLVAGLLCGGLWTIVRRGRPWSLKRIGAFAVAGMLMGGTIAVLIPNE